MKAVDVVKMLRMPCCAGAGGDRCSSSTCNAMSRNDIWRRLTLSLNTMQPLPISVFHARTWNPIKRCDCDCTALRYRCSGDGEGLKIRLSLRSRAALSDGHDHGPPARAR